MFILVIRIGQSEAKSVLRIAVKHQIYKLGAHAFIFK